MKIFCGFTAHQSAGARYNYNSHSSMNLYVNIGFSIADYPPAQFG
jgi:hypothetical protein